MQILRELAFNQPETEITMESNVDTNDFVYKQIYNGCLQGGVKNGVASDYASLGLERYNKGQYHGKVTKLIADTVKEAKKISKR